MSGAPDRRTPARSPDVRPGPPSGAAARIAPSENLARDEALLRAGRAAVRVGVLDGPAFSLGVRSPADRGPAGRAEALGLPVLRRRSGGSGLVHGSGDLAWALVRLRTDPEVGRDFPSAYARLGAGVVRWLGRLGVEAAWSAPFSLSETFCLLGPRGLVLTVRGRAIGGAAQHATATALLHHGIVNARIDRSLLARVFGLSETLLLRTVTSLDEEGVPGPSEALAESLRRELARPPPGPLG